jgi:hypothetical protein
MKTPEVAEPSDALREGVREGESRSLGTYPWRTLSGLISARRARMKSSHTASLWERPLGILNLPPWLGALCLLLAAVAAPTAQADTLFGADLDVTYMDAGGGAPPAFHGSDDAGSGADSLIRSWEPTPLRWEAYFDTLNTVEGLSIHSFNDLRLYGLEPDNIFWSHLSANVRSSAVLTDVVGLSAAELPDGGYLQFFISLDGALLHELRLRAGGYNVQNGEAEVQLRLQGTGGLNRVLFDERLVASSISQPINEVFDDVKPFSQSYIPTPLFALAAGEELSLALQLETGISFAVESIDGGRFDYFGTADVRNTATIVGVAVFDTAMNPVPNATVFSQRGLAYPLVPEPGSLLLLGGGVLILRRQRHPRWPRNG